MDYVVANNHFGSEEAAIRHICRVLKIKNTHLDLYSADQIMDMQFHEPVYVVDKLFTKGLHILAGPSKVGKSWLALWMAHQISTGQPIWDFQTHQGTVLYLKTVRLQRSTLWPLLMFTMVAPMQCALSHAVMNSP